MTAARGTAVARVHWLGQAGSSTALAPLSTVIAAPGRGLAWQERSVQIGAQVYHLRDHVLAGRDWQAATRPGPRAGPARRAAAE